MTVKEIYRKYHYYNPENLQKSLVNACGDGDLNLVKYLLTNNDLSKHLDIHKNKDRALKTACSCGKLDIVKFLLTSSELKEHADLKSNLNWIFDEIIYHKHIDILKFFIFELNIEKNEHINLYLKNNPDKPFSSWFDLREVNQQLTQELDTPKTDTKKNKI